MKNSRPRYKVSDKVAFRMIGEHAVIVDMAGNTLIKLNDTGTLVWQLLEKQTPDEIADLLRAEYDVPRSDAEKDIERFFDLMLQRRLIELVEPNSISHDRKKNE